MSKDVCWYCKFFFATVDHTPFGECRKNAPKGIDSNMVHPAVGTSNLFPQIYYSGVEFCGEFVPSPEERDAPPW